MQYNEKPVETKTCKHCDSEFEITDKYLEFYEKVSPIFPLKETGLFRRPVSNNELIKDLGNGKIKYLIPSPTLCPNCRNQRRLSWRNEGNLYKRKCDKTGKEIISMFPPNNGLVVYDKDIINNDNFDALLFGQELEIEKSFFDQFKSLLQITPLPNLTNTFESENSEYQIYSGKMKNCYMLFACWTCEYSMYSSRQIRTNYVLDCLDGTDLERCYQLINSENCYSCYYLINGNGCKNCYFSYDLENCNDCILCYNLSGKKYCINNKQYSKEEYLRKIGNIKKENISLGWKFIDEMMRKSINKNLMMINCENSIGDNLKNCNNCVNCFHFENAKNCKYIENGGMGCFNSYDGRGIGANLDLGYEILDSGINSTKIGFLISSYGCNNWL